MTPKFRYGAVAGAIGFALTGIQTLFLSEYGGLIAAICAGALAGFLLGRQAKEGKKRAALDGLVAGGITGVFCASAYVGAQTLLTFTSMFTSRATLSNYAHTVPILACLGLMTWLTTAGMGAFLAYTMATEEAETVEVVR